MSATVSIILPNLNTRLDFLAERVATIRNQTFSDWECIVIDGYSINGSWEYLTNIAKKDARFRCYQFPKEGIYKAWNSGLMMAKGEFIYIAPSDDTMSDNFLATMVAGLQQQPDCSIAHCCLTIIDEKGQKSEKKNWDAFTPLNLFNLKNKRHVRYAPFDGVLYCSYGMVYTSITQLLIRRTVFDTIGYFITNEGPTADYEWELRASLVFNTLHIPEYLATWRVHDEQATQDHTPENVTNERFVKFIHHAFYLLSEKGLIQQTLSLKDLQYPFSWLAIRSLLKRKVNPFQMVKRSAQFGWRYPRKMAEQFFRIIKRKKPVSNKEIATQLLRKLHLEENIMVL